MITLKEVYTSPNFGKPNSRGEYEIRSDCKSFVLLVDDVEVVNISLEYERFESTKPNYSCVYITYNNKYFNKESKYNNKGYTTIALQQVTEMLLKSGKVPRISLDILPDNLPSKRIATKVGYTYMNNNTYSIFHPDALKMYEEGLEYLKKEDPEIYELQMRKYMLFYKKYIASLQSNNNTDFTMQP